MDSPIPPKRSDVLGAAWARAVWLDKAINEVENDKKAVSPKLKAMVYMCQIHTQRKGRVYFSLPSPPFAANSLIYSGER